MMWSIGLTLGLWCKKDNMRKLRLFKLNNRRFGIFRRPECQVISLIYETTIQHNHVQAILGNSPRKPLKNIE